MVVVGRGIAHSTSHSLMTGMSLTEIRHCLRARPGTSVCIEGFDSSLHVEEIRTMLARHFGSDDNEGIRVPTNLDGSSIGKAYIKYIWELVLFFRSTQSEWIQP